MGSIGEIVASEERYQFVSVCKVVEDVVVRNRNVGMIQLCIVLIGFYQIVRYLFSEALLSTTTLHCCKSH